MNKTLWTIGLLAAFTCTSLARASGGEHAGAIKSHENVVYGVHGGLALLMDVYLPEESNGHALLFINGCGWHSPHGYGGYPDAMTIKDYPNTAISVAPFVEIGFAVFAITHRTAPVHRYPGAYEDVRRAVRFVRHHRAEYGLTSDNVAAIGHSSGGHLSLLAALRLEDPSESSVDPVDRESARVDAVVGIAPPTSINPNDAAGWAMEWGASFLGAPRAFIPDQYEEASPVTHVDPEDPPVLLVHGTDDAVVPASQSALLADALLKHGVDHEHIVVDGGGHGLEQLFTEFSADDENASLEAIGEWLLERLSVTGSP